MTKYTIETIQQDKALKTDGGSFDKNRERHHMIYS